MTSTTFVDVPWNGHYYKRLGWEWLDHEHMTPGLAEIRAVEDAEGMGRWSRTVMWLSYQLSAARRAPAPG